MLKRTLLIVSALSALTTGALSTFFYGGDFDGRNGLAAQVNGPNFQDALTFDDFNLGSPVNITTLGGNYLTSLQSAPTTGYFEIRTGMSAGNGGTLIAAGFAPVVQWTPTGRNGFGLKEMEMCIAANLTLAPGTYYMAVSVNGGNGDAFVSTTDGLPIRNGIGSPLGNGNSYFNSAQFGANYDPTTVWLGQPAPWDFSYTVECNPVPEPTTIGAVVLGVAGALRRRRRK